jgi:hypothetical protein
MAEIKIEKKSPVWPWILLIVIVVGVLIYVFATDRDDDTMRQDNMENRNEPLNDGNRETPRQPLNSLPITPDTEVILISILNDGPDQIEPV